MRKYCPLFLKTDTIYCLEEKCGWWNEETNKCGIIGSITVEKCYEEIQGIRFPSSCLLDNNSYHEINSNRLQNLNGTGKLN